MQLNRVSLPKSLQDKISSKQEGIIVEPSEVDEIIGDQREQTTFLLRRMDIQQARTDHHAPESLCAPDHPGKSSPFPGLVGQLRVQ